jgi:hypothetical protein
MVSAHIACANRVLFGSGILGACAVAPPQEAVMDQVSYVLPIRRCKTESARELVHTIREDRLEEYERS